MINSWISFFFPEPANCTSGFLSLDILRSLLSQNIMAYQQSGLTVYIIPEISLACSTQSRETVEGVLIAGELLISADAADTSQFLTITWWQQIRRESYNLTAIAAITELKPISEYVYSFTLNMNNDRPLDVSAESVLGIGINTQFFTLYYDASRIGITNHRVLAGFEFLDSNPISIPTIANVSTDVNTAIRGAPLLSFGDRGIVTRMMNASVSNTITFISQIHHLVTTASNVYQEQNT
jgi:hypothetical protein